MRVEEPLAKKSSYTQDMTVADIEMLNQYKLDLIDYLCQIPLVYSGKSKRSRKRESIINEIQKISIWQKENSFKIICLTNTGNF